MTNDLPNLDKIDDYLNGIMPADERAAFERALAADPALKAEFDLVQDLLTGMEHAGDEALKAQIGAAHEGLKAEGFFEKKTATVVEFQPTGQRPWYRWAAAASVMILIGAAVFFTLRQRNPYEELFDQNFYAEHSRIDAVIDDAAAPGLLNADRTRNGSRARALSLYRAGDYASARAALATHFNTYPRDTIARFYLALSAMHLAGYDDAIALLQPIAAERPGAGEDAGFQSEITWYLALAYSKHPGRAAKDSTLLLLRRLETGTDTVYVAKARAALKSLE